MAQYVALRDRRLEGGVPARPNLRIINTDGNTPLSVAFRELAAYAHKKPLRALFILCHGYAGANDRLGISADAGGMGLQLGREDLVHGNVHAWRSVRGMVQNIVVYSCAAANTESGNEYTGADGRYLMGALAIHTNASVYAADKIQWYSTHKGLARGRYEWDAWEGTLWRFLPNGQQPAVVPTAPYEFDDVMSGSI